MLSVTDLVVDLGGRRVLDGVSIEVGAGERVSLHGPSGCGKTTLLHAIAGLVGCTRGHIVVNGRDVTVLPAHRRNIGVLFQDDRLFPQFTVGENVTYALRVQGVRTSARRPLADIWLTRVGLAGFAHCSVDSLSGGEAKRVALARTLAGEPNVILLDEPLSGLDDALHDSLLADLRALFIETRATVVHVTHDRAEGDRLCDRAIEFARLIQR